MSTAARQRQMVLGIVVVSLFAALLARMWYLQVLNGEEFQLAAQQNAVQVVKEPAPRGRVLDRNGVILIDNRASNVVTIDRTALDEDEIGDVVARLSDIVGEPEAVLVARLDDERASRYAPVTVAADVTDEVVVALRERQDDLPGVGAGRVATRTYPNGNLAAHLLGYIGEVNDAELERVGEALDPGDLIGKAGVEKTFDEVLRGRDGTTRVEVDARGDPVGIIDRERPVPGTDVVLSIDVEVQRAAEVALLGGLEATRLRNPGNSTVPLVADAGSVVVLDVKEGSVVAMASYPTFDPNQLADGITAPEAAALFDESTGAPFTNRAVQGQYAAGSTWKLVVAAAALEAGLTTPERVVRDTGAFTIPDCRGKCRFQNAGATVYGDVDLRRALTVSSDVYFYDLGYQMWNRRAELGDAAMQDKAVELGFGAETGVDVPGEADGRVPTPASRAKAFADRPDLYMTGDWFAGDNVNLAIGQGELAITPIQLANAYATFFGGGVQHAPNIALRVQSRDGQVDRIFEPRVTRTIPVDPAIREPIREGLQGVTATDEGTAARAFTGFPLDRYPVIGKTGTAQAPPKQDNALFVGVAPADDPRYAVSVVMEQSGFGSTAAAPVARTIFDVLSGQSGVGPTSEGLGDP